MLYWDLNKDPSIDAKYISRDTMCKEITYSIIRIKHKHWYVLASNNDKSPIFSVCRDCTKWANEHYDKY